jgi:hypothetical protein
MSHHVGRAPFPIVIIVTLSCCSKKLVEKTCHSRKNKKQKIQDRHFTTKEKDEKILLAKDDTLPSS